MASYNELNALIDAYINRNGVQAITGQILNGVLKAMVEQLGRGYTIMGAAIPTTDPGTPDGPECYFASETGTYTDFDGLQVAPGELALLCYTPSDGWTKATIYEGFQEVGATVDGNVGTPSVGVTYANGVLSFDFHNMKGDPGQNGQDGQDGAAAGFGTIGADITGGIGTPGVSVESSGPATAKNLQFHFTNLKGETGVTSVVATVDNTTGTPACTVSLVGQQLTLAFTGLKGAQGNTGSSVDYPFTIVNNLTTDDATQALSAAQGKVLDGKVSQLEAKVDGDRYSTDKDMTTPASGAMYFGSYNIDVDIPAGKAFNILLDGETQVVSGAEFMLWFDDSTSWAQPTTHISFGTAYNVQAQAKKVTKIGLYVSSNNITARETDFNLSVYYDNGAGLVAELSELDTKVDGVVERVNGIEIDLDGYSVDKNMTTPNTGGIIYSDFNIETDIPSGKAFSILVGSESAVFASANVSLWFSDTESWDAGSIDVSLNVPYSVPAQAKTVKKVGLYIGEQNILIKNAPFKITVSYEQGLKENIETLDERVTELEEHGTFKYSVIPTSAQVISKHFITKPNGEVSIEMNGYYCTDYLEVPFESGTQIEFRSAVRGYVAAGFYDSGKNIIRVMSVDSADYESAGGTSDTLTIQTFVLALPSGTKYIRLSAGSDYSSPSDFYIKGDIVATDEIVSLKEKVEDKIIPCFAPFVKDMKVLVIGDSISTGPSSAKLSTSFPSYGNYDKWVDDLIKVGYFPTDAVNDSQHATGFVATNGTITYGGVTYNTDFLSRVKLIEAMGYDLSTFDIIIVFGGVNDFKLPVPLGESGDSDTTHFIPALEEFYAYLLDKATQARICTLLPMETSLVITNQLGLKIEDYCDAIKDVIGKYRLPYLDLLTQSGFCPTVAKFRAMWTLDWDSSGTGDGLHPNEAYQEKYLTPQIRGFVDGLI